MTIAQVMPVIKRCANYISEMASLDVYVMNRLLGHSLETLVCCLRSPGLLRYVQVKFNVN